jgi:hypothetical protein
VGAFLAVIVLAGAAGPTVVAVRLPSKDVPRYFPAGTELRVMPVGRFESLVKQATLAAQRRAATQAPRLIGAKHWATVRSGAIVGRSEFVIERARAEPGEFPLDPWTPAVTATPGKKGALGASDSGKTSLWVDQSPTQAFVIEWDLHPRALGKGRSFPLRLPGNETTFLALELPKEWVPICRRGTRRRANAASSTGQMRAWEIQAENGEIDVQVYEPAPEASLLEGGIWLSEATSVDLRRSADRDAGLINWRTEWQIELDPRNPKPLEIEVDVGLELVDVQGSSVRGYQWDRSGTARRLVVELDPGLKTTSELVLLGHARVPVEGAWVIPSLRPMNATWIGGTTTVILDENRVLAQCREMAGRRIFPVERGTPPLDRLEFESSSPHSVAELVLGRPTASVPCEVRGHLFVSGSPARFECELTWGQRDPALSEIEIDLSPTWLVDQVLLRGKAEPLSWHPSLLASGNTRLHVALPAGSSESKEQSIVVRASSTVQGGRGPLQLPRVRPVAAPILDEAWLAWVDRGTMIQPAAARGLAWIDSNEVPGLVGARTFGAEWREALAWRWIADAADARVEREPIEIEPAASVRVRARIEPERSRLLVTGWVTIYAGANSLESVPLWLGAAPEPLSGWHFSDRAGSKISTQLMTQPERAQLGLPTEGLAVHVAVAVPNQTDKTVLFHAEFPWRSDGAIPLVCPPTTFMSRGVVVLNSPASVRSRVQSSGLRVVAASALEMSGDYPLSEFAGEPREDSAMAGTGFVDAFGYKEPGSELKVVTEPLKGLAAPAIVRDAQLATTVDPNGTVLNRLRLFLNVADLRTLDFEMPRGHTLVRVRRDGAEVSPTQSSKGISIPLAGASQGSRASMVVIDYLAEKGALVDGYQLRPEIPKVSLEYLSFEWVVVTPAEWGTADPGKSLITTDPSTNEGTWPFGVLGVPTSPLWPWQKSFVARDGLRNLNDRLAEKVSGEMSFAEWLSLWDSEPLPIVIDRVALGSVGVGPRSQCVPALATAARGDLGAMTLSRYGLTFVATGNAIVITTRAQEAKLLANDLGQRAVAEAMAWGSDRTDRFQTLSRWRGELSPRIMSASGDDPTLRIKIPPGWSSSTFTGSNVPDIKAYVYLINYRVRIISGWMIVCLSLLGWSWLRVSLGRWRVPLLAAVICGLFVLESWIPARFAACGAAVGASALFLCIFEIAGQLWRSPRPGRGRWRSESSLVRRGATALVGVVLAGCSLLAAYGVANAAPDGNDDTRILALFPYNGSFDPTVPVRDVILRLADFNQLTRLAATAPAKPESVIRATGALHRVKRVGKRDASVETELDLVAIGRAPFVWSFPVAAARDIDVRLDGQRVPIAIEQGGSTGKVTIGREGEHRLLIRRSVIGAVEAEGYSGISVPVGSLSNARVVVEPGADGQQDAELMAAGGTEQKSDKSLAGNLGPADRIIVRWKGTALAQQRLRGSVDGLMLWDILPAGDRLRARFTWNQPAGVATLRVAHQPGLILRSARLDGSGEVFCEEIAGNREWLFYVNRGARHTTILEIDCWMPQLGVKAGEDDNRALGSRNAESFVRRMPEIQPLGVERYAGSLGVRRPGDWTGRFDPLPASEPIGDETFVDSWGMLPQEPLTLCGTSRFVHECRASLVTGPGATRIQLKPTVDVQIESGRVAVTVAAEVLELSGHLRELKAILPENLKVIEVSADGLSDWSVSAGGRLRLNFDRPFAGSRRRLRIVAFLPIVEEPLRQSGREYRIKTPWLTWEGVDAIAGFVTLTSPAKPEMRGASGLTLISTESARAGLSAAPRHRSTYRVDNLHALGEMVWESIPARVNVAIESQLTIDPDSSEWIAVLRYDVIGGALDVIRLRMPAIWAANAELRFAGSAYQLTRETSGAFAFWSITPERPIRGSQRFVVRATRASNADREIDYPEVSPLGQGGVDAYLTVIDATDRTLGVTSASGLQPAQFATRFRAGEFASAGGRLVGAYRVGQKSWALRVQLPRGTGAEGGSPQVPVRLALADVTAVVSSDQSVLGRAVYDTVPGTGNMMPFVLPPESELLWASLDQNPVTPMRDVAGRWSINCDERRASRIGLTWRTHPQTQGSGGSTWPVSLPRAGVGSTTTLVTVYVPDDFSLLPNAIEGLDTTTMPRLELARAERMAGSVSELIARFDRSSGRDHERLVALLINHELALRSAQRSLQSKFLSRARPQNMDVQNEIAAIRAARETRDETVRRAGLASDLESARIYIGEARATQTDSRVSVSEPAVAERIRLVGTPFASIGTLAGSESTAPPPSLRFTRNRIDGSGISVDRLLTSALFAIGLALTMVLPAGSLSRSALALTCAAGLVGYIAGPWLMTAAVAAALVAARSFPAAR